MQENTSKTISKKKKKKPKVSKATKEDIANVFEPEQKTMDLEHTINEATRDFPFKEKTEMGEVFDNLDDDRADHKNMSKIDFNSRLSHAEATGCLVIDELRQLGILDESIGITRQKKRLSVSLGGLGRQEKVQIASASRQAELGSRGGGGILNWMFSKREE